jgi:hypothetical protein
MLIASVAIFVCCWLPLNVINLIIEYREEEVSGPYLLLVFFVVHVFAMSSTVYNPFLYAWMNDSFRVEFKRALPHCIVAAFSCGGSSSDASGGTVTNNSRRGQNGGPTAAAASMANAIAVSRPIIDRTTVGCDAIVKPALLVYERTTADIRRSSSATASHAIGALAAISGNDVLEPEEVVKLMSATDDEVVTMAMTITSTTQF